MAEAATITAPAAPAATPAPTPTAPAAPVAPQSAGATLTSMPTGPDWASGFKDDMKSYVSQKGFKTAEDLAVSYQNLEKLKGVPENRLLKLPEKMEGQEAREVWEKLGAPKEAKGYEIPRAEKATETDIKFVESIEGIFHKNNLTKSQALGVVQNYNEMIQAHQQAQAIARTNSINQDTETLKQEWGPHYETNLNLCKQGAKILGLDAKTIDTMEAVQGRATLFKTLQRIGVSMGESNFVTGDGSGVATGKTPEQAQGEIKQLIQDRKFGKRLQKGDVEAVKQWNELNKLAAPGEKQIV